MVVVDDDLSFFIFFFFGAASHGENENIQMHTSRLTPPSAREIQLSHHVGMMPLSNLCILLISFGHTRPHHQWSR